LNGFREVKTGQLPISRQAAKGSKLAGIPASVLSQENAGNILAAIGVDHHEIDLAFCPVADLIEAVRVELLVNQNRSRVDGGSDEFKPDRLASYFWHVVIPKEAANSTETADCGYE
jgi:hypothetical protein